MQFVDLSRYVDVRTPAIVPPYVDLKNLPPVWLTQDLMLAEEPKNLAYAAELGMRGITLAPIRRRPPHEAFVERNAFPRRVLLEMTSRCNYLCRMCPQQNLRRPRMDMPGDQYRHLIDVLDEHGIEGLWLFNLGEPLLHPEFKENLLHVSSKTNLGVIWLSTNGRYFTESHIRTVLDSRVDYLNYSAHAITEEIYDTVAPPGNFAAVQENLERFYELKGTKALPRKPFLHVQMIDQETTKHEIDGFLDRHFRRADLVSVNMLEFVGVENNAAALTQRVRPALTSCNRVARNDCFIFSNGEVTLCDTAYNADIPLGNVHERSLVDIWNGAERHRILELNTQGRMLEVEFCRGCLDYDL
jgi:radical SAM protein with 4Fe4S-binding SPASM domain